MIRVTLSNVDRFWATHVAFHRQEKNCRRKPDPARSAPRRGYMANHYTGALGEIALLRHLHWPTRFWNLGIKADDSHRGAGDVGPYEVKSTRNVDLTCLIVPPADVSIMRPLVRMLIDIEARFADVVGWAWPWEVGQGRFWNPRLPTPAYLVPASLLHDPLTLPHR